MPKSNTIPRWRRLEILRNQQRQRLAIHLATTRWVLGITQTELSKLSEVPQPSISDIERAKGDVTIDVLNRLADAMEMRIQISFIPKSESKTLRFH